MAVYCFTDGTSGRAIAIGAARPSKSEVVGAKSMGPPSLVVIGDSMSNARATDGAGPWVARLAERISARLINYSVEGATIREAGGFAFEQIEKDQRQFKLHAPKSSTEQHLGETQFRGGARVNALARQAGAAAAAAAGLMDEKSWTDWDAIVSSYPPNSLAVFWAGNNDFIAAMERGTLASLDVADLGQMLLDMMLRLHRLGINNFLVGTLHPFHKAPQFAEEDQFRKDDLSEKITAFNSYIRQNLIAEFERLRTASATDPHSSHSRPTRVHVDVFEPAILVEAVLKSPEAYGVASTGASCLRNCKDARKYLWWDSKLHVTQVINQRLADQCVDKVRRWGVYSV